MARIQATHAVVKLVPYRVIRNLVEHPPDHVPECMTPEHISAKKHHIHNENEASNPDPKTLRKEERPHCVIDKKTPDNVREPQKVAMKILQNEGKTSLSKIALAGLAHRARRRVSPERFVIRAAVVVAGQTKQAGIQRMNRAGEKGRKFGYQFGFGPNNACGELPKSSGE